MAWIGVGIGFAVLCLYVFWPLFRKNSPETELVDSAENQSNIEALQQQLADAETDLEQGRITQEDFDATETELAERLLQEQSESEVSSPVQPNKRPLWLGVLLLAIVTCFSVALYLDFSPSEPLSKRVNNALNDSGEQTASGETVVTQGQPEEQNIDTGPLTPLADVGALSQQQAQERLQQLNKHLKAQPDDFALWAEQSQIQRRFGQFDLAIESMNQAIEKNPDPTQKITLRLARIEMLAQSAQARQEPIPEEAYSEVNEIINRNPNHTQALWYGAMLARGAGENLVAMARLERLMALNPPEVVATALQKQYDAWEAEDAAAAKLQEEEVGGSEQENAAVKESTADSATSEEDGSGDAAGQSTATEPDNVEQSSQTASDAPKQAADSPSSKLTAEELAALPPRTINVTVTIGEGIDLGDMSGAAVYVYARAKGSRMPLVVERFIAPSFPLVVNLDESNAMLPNVRLADYDELEVLAKVSYSGNPQSQRGDWWGIRIIDKQTKDTEVAISQQVR